MKNPGKNDRDLNPSRGDSGSPKELKPEYKRAVQPVPSSSSVIKSPMKFGSKLDDSEVTKSYEAKQRPQPDIPSESLRNRWNYAAEAKGSPMFPLHNPVEVKGNASEVLTRLDSSLQQRSVEAKFDDENCQVLCKTNQFLIYSIDLYAGSENPENTRLEIIRRQGCSFAFRQEREAIINAANGLGADSKPKRSNQPPRMELPPELLSLYKPPTKNDLTIILEKAVDQLHTSRRDVQLFTLQNLAAMTKPDKINSGPSVTMAKLILQENVANIREIITENVSSFEPKDQMNEEILNAYLSTLSNSLESMTLKADNAQNNMFEDFANRLIEVLVDLYDQRYCGNCVHNMYLTVKCLCILIGKSPLSSIITDEKLEGVMRHAKKCGQKQHLKLQNEASSALDILGCT